MLPLLTAFALATAWPACALDLVRNGTATTTIVVPDKPLPVAAFAAEELQYHLERATGARLAIAKESAAEAAGAHLFVGACRAAAKAGLDTDALPPNGFLLKLIGDRFFLVGDDSDGPPAWILHNNRTRVGTLFAVYEFLEKHLGVRWLWPGELGEVIPKRASVFLDSWDQTGKPAFVHARWRDGGNTVAGEAGWASPQVRSKFLSEQSKWLRRHRFALGVNMDMAHAYTQWWDRHKDDHPEYFNLLPDGTRRPDPTYHGAAPSLISMCVSEPAFHRAVVENWKQTRSPERPYIDVSENDTPGKCNCPRCLSWDVRDPALEAPWESRLEYAKKAFDAAEAGWDKHLGSLSDRYARYYLAVQKEAEKVDPNAVVMGYAYANYVDPPCEVKLNERVLLGVVPPMYFPWTDEVLKDNRARWDGWRATGARMFLRPNWMLDGHNLPLFIARKLGEDFRYFAHNGMIGTDFDSLTGQYSTQGPNLYVLARLHDAPQLEVDAVLDEYYSAFGKAKEAVRAYFAHWEQLCDAITEAPEGLHWSRFYRQAGEMFTPQAMARANELLAAAATAARGDEVPERRVTFLQHGLRNAELTLAAQAAYVKYRETGDVRSFRLAVEELDSFRRSVESELIANMGYLAWAEGNTWDRKLLEVMKEPGQRLADPWKFRWDPQNEGDGGNWFADDLDTSNWLDLATDGPWEEQPAGKQWKQAHRGDYNGVAWYRTTFGVERDPAKPRVRLLFGAVDEACVVWVNGAKVLERPYPYNGDADSWKKAFEVDITDQVRYDRPNFLVVRVEDNAGAGGIWRPVWVQQLATGISSNSVLPDGGFEEPETPWKQHVMCGEFAFALDREHPHTGAVCARLQCNRVGTPEDEQKQRTKAWARWYQTGIPVGQGKPYRLHLWVRTSDDFKGTLALWVTGDATRGTVATNLFGTEGLWREVTATGIVPKGGELSVYLNVRDGTGTAWFDEVELVPEPKEEP
ncbi:MAG: hypothetical protein AUJ96_23415 [Armatimonadetes bacterium CG2_30_66_41]|nr:MAG: hypothetical protein AUJ96_23415 [Armatimonadetes bacterium CG2_30_66_41]